MIESGQESGQTTTRAEELLLEFLGDHDAECPVCRYNLRGLTRPVCPECRQTLVLTVGTTRLRIGWLLLALVPGIFAGIAACFVCIPTVAIYVEDGVLILPFVGTVLFGWVSGLFTILLAIRWRTRFLIQSRTRQRIIVAAIWFIHLAALGLFFMALAQNI